MKHVYCKECGSKHPVSMAKKEAYARTEFEPAEYVRVVKGWALKPAPEQCVLYVNGTAYKLTAGHYNCDLCGRYIQPSDEITCITAWNETQSEPPAWEYQYLKEIK